MSAYPNYSVVYRKNGQLVVLGHFWSLRNTPPTRKPVKYEWCVRKFGFTRLVYPYPVPDKVWIVRASM